MEKIKDSIGDALKDSIGDSASLREEFKKAQENMMNKLPTPEHFMNMIDQLKDMSDEEKEKLKKNLLERALNADKFKEMFNKRKGPEANYFIFVGMILLIVVVFGECLELLSVSL